MNRSTQLFTGAAILCMTAASTPTLASTTSDGLNSSCGAQVAASMTPTQTAIYWGAICSEVEAEIDSLFDEYVELAEQLDEARERSDYETMRKLKAKQDTVQQAIADANKLKAKCKSILKLKK